MTTTTEKKRTRKKSALMLHHDGECGCSRTSNPQECIYQEFLDGWSFTPDVGNGQKRGEVFTPRFVVDKMATDVGLFPREGVYDLTYDVPVDEAHTIVSKRVIEPAVGTANFLSTILWHKLEYAYTASLTDNGELDLDTYHQQLLTAVTSVYAYDIDAGNLEVTRRRLLAQDIPLNAPETITAWELELKNALSVKVNKKLSTLIATVVQESLNSAVEHWERFFDAERGGVIQQLYRKHTGSELPEFLHKHCTNILKANIKIFNGIEKEDTVKDDFLVPGWKNVVWDWWEVSTQEDGTIELDSRDMPLAHQMLVGKIEQLEQQSKRMKEEKMVEVSDGLFPSFEWATEKDRLEHAKIEKELDKLQRELAAIL